MKADNNIYKWKRPGSDRYGIEKRNRRAATKSKFKNHLHVGRNPAPSQATNDPQRFAEITDPGWKKNSLRGGKITQVQYSPSRCTHLQPGGRHTVSVSRQNETKPTQGPTRGNRRRASKDQ